MERQSLIIFPISTILLGKASNCYDKYGKYVKWSALGLLTLCGLKYCVSELMVRYRDDKKLTPPPATSSSTAGPSTSAQPVPKPVAPRRPKIFQGLDGTVEFPILGNRESIEAYVKKHTELSKIYLEKKNYNLASYHTSLLLFIHPDPMAYFETNSGYMPKETYAQAKKCLGSLLKVVEEQMKNDEADLLS